MGIFVGLVVENDKKPVRNRKTTENNRQVNEEKVNNEEKAD